MPKSRAVIVPMTLALLIAGCGQKTSQMAGSTENGAGDIAAGAGNSIANVADDVKEAITPTPTGQEFADKAAKSDAFEIASARLAEKQATSPAIKRFAAMMITDHTASTARIKQAAREASPAITPDATLTDDQNGKLADLGKLSGAEFDRKYADQQIDAHQAALSLMRLYADHGEVPSLKVAAGAIRPKVQMHLDRIKAIKDELSADKAK